MKWPWVSRHRLTAAEKALDDANKERREMLDRLLGSGQESRHLAKPLRRADNDEPAEDAVPAEPPEDQGEVVQFTTPFDRIERRYDQAHAGGKRPEAKFKARA